MSETICFKFLETAKKQANRIAILTKSGERWNEISWSGYLEAVSATAAGLQVAGVRKGDRVAIISNTRYEWAVCDLAILGLGAITVPIYLSSTNEDIEFILNDAGVKVLISETSAIVGRNKDLIARTKVETIITFNSTSTSTTPLPLTFSELMNRGEAALKMSPTLYELAVRELSRDDVATIVYTSGTTGTPKGVVHTHTQILSEVGDAFPLLGVTSRDRSLTFLPFAHVLGRIEIWGHALIGYTMAFAQGLDRLKTDLVDVKPTLLMAVPRVFEKIYYGIQAQADISSIKRKTFDWAFSVGREISKHKMTKQPLPLDLAIKYQLARKLVFDTIQNRLGGNLRFAVCGGAPLSQTIAEFFHAAGLLILEGYGLTETIGAITVNTPFDYRFGTVGKAIGDVKLKLSSDGELLVQSKKVMKSYYKNSNETEQALEGGWFHTGDIAEISPEGYVRITDRKKDLIKTAGGKYVAPQKLEGLLKLNKFISNAHIHGDQRKYVVALLTLNFEEIKRYSAEHDILIKKPNGQESEARQLVENLKVKDLIRRAVAEVNSVLASYESIKNFAILPEDFTVESGELTPSLKVKRKVVDKNYSTIIDGLYGIEN